MTLKEQIVAFLEQILAESPFFVVDVAVSPSKVRQKVTILLDKDTGISLDECADISRQLADWLEPNEIIPNAYTLEVSSPGTDWPLSGERQYRKNIGRILKITAKDGQEHKGTLTDVSASGVTLSIPPDKKKKQTQPTLENIAFEQIAKAQVQVVW